MKRRNFLSGVLASPLALKARFLALFRKRPVELCGAPILGRFVHDCQSQSQLARTMLTHNQSLTARQREIVQLLAEGKSLKELADESQAELAARKAAFQAKTRRQPIRCSRPRGHKGPHVLLNPSVR